MSEISFFTPVSFASQPKSWSETLLQKVDDYFYLGGEKAQVVPGARNQDGEGVVLKSGSQSILITALKVVSFMFFGLPLLLVKAVLRCTHQFHLVTPQEVLENEIEISQETLDKIQELMPKIRSVSNHPDLQWYAISNSIAFSLKSIPNLIFKTAQGMNLEGDEERNRRTEQIFQNMIKAQEVCIENNLNLLVIPHAKKFEVGGKTIIAQEKLQFNENADIQSQYYKEFSSSLNETIDQVTTFILGTGFSATEWNHMPIMDVDEEFEGPRHIALFNFRSLDGAVKGIFGDNEIRGLVRCLFSEEQIDRVLEQASQNNVVDRRQITDQIKQQRMEEIEEDDELYQLYADNGILEDPAKEIPQIDLSSELGLTQTAYLYKREKVDETTVLPFTLKNVVDDVIKEINSTLKYSKNAPTIKQGRRFFLNLNSGLLKHYDRFGLPKEESLDNQNSKSWLQQVLEALVSQRYLFKIIGKNNLGYHIQA